MIIDGKKVSQELLSKISKRISQYQRPPGLAVILVGDNLASEVYVNKKKQACKEVGFYSEKIEFSSDITQERLLEQIEKYNLQSNIDGILVQLPLPGHIDQNLVLESIDPKKDVDGFHFNNVGKLAQNLDCLRPCTSKGIMTLLKSNNIEVSGKDAVIIGASNIVGRPMALELLNNGATVTICHKKTKDIAAKAKQADIIVVAVGVPNFLKGEWLKQDAIVVDVGINRLENGKLVGDVDFESAQKVCSYITPVPGGVGPMTIATLLENTMISCERRLGIS